MWSSLTLETMEAGVPELIEDTSHTPTIFRKGEVEWSAEAASIEGTKRSGERIRIGDWKPD